MSNVVTRSLYSLLSGFVLLVSASVATTTGIGAPAALSLAAAGGYLVASGAVQTAGGVMQMLAAARGATDVSNIPVTIGETLRSVYPDSPGAEILAGLADSADMVGDLFGGYAAGRVFARGAAAGMAREAAERAIPKAVEAVLVKNAEGVAGTLIKCFVAGTMVLTPSGAQAIESIEVGDQVWSRCEYTGEVGWKSVAETFRNTATELVHLDADDNPDNAELIGTTEHPFRIAVGDGTETWIAMGDLAAGDALIKDDGTTTTVRSVALERAPEGSTFKTYNFEVEDWHTYYVAPQWAAREFTLDGRFIWVHNLCPTNKTEVARDLLQNGARSAFKRASALNGKPINHKEWREIKALAMLQNEVDIADQALGGVNGPNVLNVLTGPQSVRAAIAPKFIPAYYGWALEAKVARQIRNNPNLNVLFEHTGYSRKVRPFVDFKGKGAFAGMIFDVTTTAQIGDKAAKYGKSILIAAY